MNPLSSPTPASPSSSARPTPSTTKAPRASRTPSAPPSGAWDFNLYCAATGIRRVHMHQGTDYRYAAWQPVNTVNTTKGTKPPYYGSVAVAESLGDLTKGNVSVAEIALPSIYESAYATYVGRRLERIVVVQMREFNYTNNTSGTSRPSET